MQIYAQDMTAKIFIDLATQPFVADLVFPEGLPKRSARTQRRVRPSNRAICADFARRCGFVTLFVGCCQRTPQPGKLVDHIPLQQGASSDSQISVVRRTCYNQTYTEFCDAKIYVRREADENGGESFPCNLRHSFDSGVLTEQEHRRLHIQREVPELCGDITPIQKVWDCCDCQYCGASTAPRDHAPHVEANHSGFGQSCIVCRRAFKNESTLLKHLCLHAQDGFHCSVCRKVFSSKDLCNRHVQRNACSPTSGPEPDCTKSCVEATTNTVDVTMDDPSSVQVIVSPKQAGSGLQLLGEVRARRNRLPCPHCPRFCFSQAALQVHLRRKHISNAPLKCPPLPEAVLCRHCILQAPLHLRAQRKRKGCQSLRDGIEK
ncbi:hypothetical protein MRX96_026538 [Rhipicephalus microplus]